jgi:hypothetical protein
MCGVLCCIHLLHNNVPRSFARYITQEDAYMMVLDKMLDDIEIGSCCRCVVQQRVSSAEKETGMVKGIAHAYTDTQSTHRAHTHPPVFRSLLSLALSLSLALFGTGNLFV